MKLVHLPIPSPQGYLRWYIAACIFEKTRLSYLISKSMNVDWYIMDRSMDNFRLLFLCKPVDWIHQITLNTMANQLRCCPVYTILINQYKLGLSLSC